MSIQKKEFCQCLLLYFCFPPSNVILICRFLNIILVAHIFLYFFITRKGSPAVSSFCFLSCTWLIELKATVTSKKSHSQDICIQKAKCNCTRCYIICLSKLPKQTTCHPLSKKENQDWHLKLRIELNPQNVQPPSNGLIYLWREVSKIFASLWERSSLWWPRMVGWL